MATDIRLPVFSAKKPVLLFCSGLADINTFLTM